MLHAPGPSTVCQTSCLGSRLTFFTSSNFKHFIIPPKHLLSSPQKGIKGVVVVVVAAVVAAVAVVVPRGVACGVVGFSVCNEPLPHHDSILCAVNFF